MVFFRKILFLFLSLYHYFWALFSALFYFFPSRKIKVIGVTGTKGKSTVVELLAKIFEEAGEKVASFSSIKIKIGKEERTNALKMTMPGRGELQKFLKKAKEKGCKIAIIEVTSEGILQHRHRFIRFEASVFTNLSPEHIERHGSFEAYRKEKIKLFKATKNIHILNLDDKNVDHFLKEKAKEKWGFTIEGRKKKGVKVVEAKNLVYLPFGAKFKIEKEEFKINLPGKFNVYNALAAIATSLSFGVSLSVIKKALLKVKGIPGRMEIVIKEPFWAIVDYAHTPDSLEAVYSTLKKFLEKKQLFSSRLICVLGATGGGRDKWKRPKMGEIAGKFCDVAIVTNEDPYDEDPQKIIEEVAKGVIKQNKKVLKILDRREAIKTALSLAKRNDIVVITGKGCEPWMCVEKGKKIPWDDRKITKEEFEKIKNKYGSTFAKI